MAAVGRHGAASDLSLLAARALLPHPRRLNLALGIGTFATGTDAALIAGLLPPIARDLHVAPSTVGQLVPAFALTYGLLGPLLAGSRVGRGGRALRAGMALFAAANLLAALSPDLGVLFFARVAAAAGAALYVPAAAALAARSSPAGRRGSALSGVLAGGTAGAVAGVPLGALVASHLGWRWAFWLVSGFAAISLVALGRWLPADADADAAPTVLSERLRPLADAAVRRVLAATAFAFLAEFAVYAYLGVIGARQAGLDEALLAPLLLLFGVAGVVGNWLSGRASDRFGPERSLVASLGLLVVLLAAFPLLDRTVPTLFVAAALLGGIGWSITAPQQLRLVTMRPDVPANVLALNQSVLYLGIGLAGPLGALSVAAGAGRLDGLLPALPAAAALALVAVDARRGARRASGEV